MQTQKVARWWKVVEEKEDIIRYVDKGEEVLGFARSFREDLPALGKLLRKSASTGIQRHYEEVLWFLESIKDRVALVNV